MCINRKYTTYVERCRMTSTLARKFNVAVLSSHGVQDRRRYKSFLQTRQARIQKFNRRLHTKRCVDNALVEAIASTVASSIAFLLFASKVHVLKSFKSTSTLSRMRATMDAFLFASMRPTVVWAAATPIGSKGPRIKFSGSACGW